MNTEIELIRKFNITSYIPIQGILSFARGNPDCRRELRMLS